MRCIPGNSIVISTRQRKDIKTAQVLDLADSIADKGLLHPIVVRRKTDKNNTDWHYLIAGQRRMEAMLGLHENKISFKCDGVTVPLDKFPALFLDEDLTEFQLKEAELEENLLREDLTWQEKAQAINDLHNMRKEKDPDHTILETAKAVRKPEQEALSSVRAEVSRATVIAGHLNDPDVAAAPNEKQAFSIVSRKMKNEFETKLRELQPDKKESPHTLHNINAIDFFKTCPPNTFDCIIADLPYGIHADTFRDAAMLSHKYSDDGDESLPLYETILNEGFTACQEDATIYLFCDIEYFLLIRDLAGLAGWKPLRTPLIWTKGAAGHLVSGHILGFRRTYELILVAYKGEQICKSLYNDVIADIPVVRKDKVHAAQKPVALYERLLNHICYPGFNVLDPCCGSGTVFRACTNLSLTATGIEIDTDMCKEAEASRHAEKSSDSISERSQYYTKDRYKLEGKEVEDDSSSPATPASLDDF